MPAKSSTTEKQPVAATGRNRATEASAQPETAAQLPSSFRLPPRAIIEHVRPEINGGRFPIKRTVGEEVEVLADVFAEGHDSVVAVLCWRRAEQESWREVPMQFLGNDRWRATFTVEVLTPHYYTVRAWVDHFLTWHHDLAKKSQAGQDVGVELLEGAELVEKAEERARDISTADARRLREWADDLRGTPDDRSAALVERVLGEELPALVGRYPDRSRAAAYHRELMVDVDDERARYGAWYELFPRSCSPQAGKHGTLRDCEQRLSYIASLGFDIVYLPPVHPIGSTFRKGKNNSTAAGPDDPGSPWAIGAAEGGHKAVHPELGTLEDFRHFVQAAAGHGLEVALDIAYQCTPDHPWVKEHPEWFRWRPDGTIQYAENPPKKYQDIYPIQFESPRWKELWEELKSVVEFWMEQGVRIFRVDNPHTKPFAFWEWAIGEIRKQNPRVLFLAEAFTRPRVMERLAKLGFNQSYTYFTWRNSKWELTQYFTELTQSEVREYMRPNLWPNTPDILPEYLQYGGRPAFITRFVLAATLGASYGIYGPAYELLEHQAIAPGKEEYLDSEKYEIKQWDLDRPDSLRETIARVNRVRRQNPALHGTFSLRFHHVDNDQIVAYTKTTPDLSNIVLTVVNLDPYHTQSGWLTLPLESMGIDASQPYQVHDLLTESRYFWNGATNYVELNPHVTPAHIFRLRRKVRTEKDFDYFM